MNPELDEKLKKHLLDKSTKLSTFLLLVQGSYLSAECRDSIPGDDNEEKALNIYNYVQGITPKPIVKRPINIVIADDSSSLEYVRFLNQKYEVTVVKTQDVKRTSDIDLILFTGGEDVNPQQYGEKTGKYTGVNKNRDSKEINTFNMFEGKVPMLGICRGNQLLTVLSGGKLIQHVEGHGQDHTIIFTNGKRYNITSTHHQMVFPFNLRKDTYEIIAHSEYFRSNTYLNGDNEEIDLPNEFVEPEIVFYKRTNSLCIQGHPEYNHCDVNTTNKCLNLIDSYLLNPIKVEKINIEDLGHNYEY